MEKISGDYLVELNNFQIIDEQEDTISVVTEADLFTKGKEVCIAYTEYDDDDPEVFWNTMVRTVPGSKKVRIIRSSGEFGLSSMELETEVKHHSHYKTPYGDLMMGIFTSTVESEFDENGGRIVLKYTIDYDTFLVSTNELTITVKRKGEPEKCPQQQ